MAPGPGAATALGGWFMLGGLTRRGLAVVSLVLALAAPVAAQPAKPIKVGAFLAVTGPAAMLGDPEAKTLRLYVERINRAGGVAGSKLELVLYDTASSVDRAIDQAQRLIEADKVALLIGGSTTGETMAVVPLAEASRIPMISLAAGFAVMDTVR